MFTLTPSISLLFATAFFLSIVANQTFAAKSCDHYQAKIKHYEDLRRAGGSMANMNRWTVRGRELEEALRQCTQNQGGAIQIISGSPAKTSTRTKAKTAHFPLRKNTTDDEQLRKLIQTCNYWIAQSNEIASQDNLNFRSSACNAVDNYQPETQSPSASNNQLNVRKLKDCIKPNNLIDADVNECIKGNMEPTWKNNQHK